MKKILLIIWFSLVSGCAKKKDSLVEKPREQSFLITEYSFKESTELSEDFILSAKTVLFPDNAKVITNGHVFKLESEELLAKNLNISTFQVGSKAQTHVTGRSGGLVEIHSKYASGSMEVFMRGENGGDGVDGAVIIDRASNGVIDTVTNMQPEILCINYIKDSFHGWAGKAGNDGTNSSRGGDTGVFIVEIENQTGFTVSVTQEPGLSGRAGRGSDGQLGGFGVPYKIPVDCPQGKRGSDGRNGVRGRDGNRPVDGNIESKCISLGKGKGNCK